MNSRILFRVIVISAFLVSSSFANIMKCCPYGKVVQFDENSFPKQYNCEEESLSSSEFKHTNSELEFSMQWNAHNVLADSSSHWPLCDDKYYPLYAILNASNVVSKSASCVDIMNNNYYVFTCDGNPYIESDFRNIFRLRKCCENGSSYDIFTRQCVVHRLDLLTPFEDILNDKIVTFEIGLPDCTNEEVLIEYFSNVHQLNINEDTLVVKNSIWPDVITQNSYCLETTMNSEADLPDGADLKNFQQKISSKWIAKVCRPKSICNQIPCIRKCCKEGQKMFFDNKTKCEKHDRHLDMKFHSFDSRKSPEEPKAMEPTGEL